MLQAPTIESPDEVCSTCGGGLVTETASLCESRVDRCWLTFTVHLPFC